MNKKILLLIILIGISPVLQIFATSVGNMYQAYNDWMEDLSEMCEHSIEGIKLSNSFAAKQATWYWVDAALRKIEIELNSEALYLLSENNNDNHIEINICKNKINFVNNALTRLDEVISKIEKQFSIPAGQFKVRTIKFIESQKNNLSEKPSY
jgi:hypothetical protein